MNNESIARSSKQIDDRYRYDMETDISVDIRSIQIFGSWPCVRLIGLADGAAFVDCDLRGADLNDLSGHVRFVCCQLYGSELPAGAELVDCERDDLFAIPEHRRAPAGAFG